MKFIVLISAMLCTCFAGFSQAQDWRRASGWVMYDTIARGRIFQWDSLSFYRSTHMNDDTMKYYMSDVLQIPTENTKGAVWMGYYHASCQLRDTTRRLLISRYGGFFEDLATNSFYEIPIPDRASWLEYFSQKFGSIGRAGKSD